MEAKDLRIGSYVGAILNEDSQNFFTVIETGETMKSYEGLSTVDVIYCERYNTGFWNIDYFEPIPLTEEWLIKFGAKEYGSFGNWKQMIIEGENELLICRIFDKGIALFCLDRCHREELRFINKCEFIHRFQNIAFELGEELTIKEK